MTVDSTPIIYWQNQIAVIVTPEEDLRSELKMSGSL